MRPDSPTKELPCARNHSTIERTVFTAAAILQLRSELDVLSAYRCKTDSGALGAEIYGATSQP